MPRRRPSVEAQATSADAAAAEVLLDFAVRRTGLPSTWFSIWTAL